MSDTTPETADHIKQIAEAHRYVDSGRKKGNVIITLKHDD
jgi:hypothetical protein